MEGVSSELGSSSWLLAAAAVVLTLRAQLSAGWLLLLLLLQAHVQGLVVALARRPDLQTGTIYHEARVAAKQLIEIPRLRRIGNNHLLFVAGRRLVLVCSKGMEKEKFQSVNVSAQLACSTGSRLYQLLTFAATPAAPFDSARLRRHFDGSSRWTHQLERLGLEHERSLQRIVALEYRRAPGASLASISQTIHWLLLIKLQVIFVRDQRRHVELRWAQRARPVEQPLLGHKHRLTCSSSFAQRVLGETLEHQQANIFRLYLTDYERAERDVFRSFLVFIIGHRRRRRRRSG